MAQLAARNQEIRTLYGIAQDTGKLQSFASGGIVQGRYGEPVIVEAHAGEIVLNSRQQAALFAALSAPRLASAAPVVPVTNVSIDMGVDHVTLEDRADTAVFFDERARVVERFRAMGGKEL